MRKIFANNDFLYGNVFVFCNYLKSSLGSSAPKVQSFSSVGEFGQEGGHRSVFGILGLPTERK